MSIFEKKRKNNSKNIKFKKQKIHESNTVIDDFMKLSTNNSKINQEFISDHFETIVNLQEFYRDQIYTIISNDMKHLLEFMINHSFTLIEIGRIKYINDKTYDNIFI